MLSTIPSLACNTLRAGGRRYQVTSRPYTSSLQWNSRKKNQGLSSRTFQVGSCRCMHKLAGTTTRDMADLEDRLNISVGNKVRDPLLDTDLSTLGWMNRRLAVSKDGTVQILLRLPSLLHPELDRLKEAVKIEAEKEMTAWASKKGLDIKAKVNVEALPTKPIPWMARDPEDQEALESTLGPGLSNVAHCIAVYSCKGGVGKSTVAVNLAYELARMGGRVGILDVDVYGPSLPVLVQPDDPAVRQSPLGKGMVYPIKHEGVNMLSLGFVSAKSGVPGSGQNSGAAVLRGPMAGKVVTQLLKGTDWGDLDVLILDMPPGTGDVQLTVCQEVDLSGAVGVSTPSKLAIADARKGIEMFSTIGIPTLALVENMSYFECEGGGVHYPFGKGFGDFMEDSAIKSIGPENVCRLPISQSANEANDSGIPLSLARPESASTELNALEALAKNVSRELFLMPYRSIDSQGQVRFQGSQETFDISSVQLSKDKSMLLVRVFSDEGAFQKKIMPRELRRRDPKTGHVLEDDADTTDGGDTSGMVTLHKAGSAHSEVEADLKANNIEKKAKIGFEVSWSDGAKYIYSRRAIVMAAGGELV